jgi:predicted transcriptional regulator
MKVPQNYNAGATKKVNPLEAAIAGNFSKNTELFTTEAKSQTINAMPAREEAPVVQPQVSVPVAELAQSDAQAAQAVTEPKTPSRREVKEKFLVSMSKGERSIFKSFCALKGVSMNHFVMCAMDYFKEDLENGKVSISSHSYKRKEG